MKVAIYPEWLNDLITMGAGTGDELVKNLRVGPLKIIVDGSMGSRTAHHIVPYPDPLSGYPNGKPSRTRSELLALPGRVREVRLQAAVHAIGDAAYHGVLDTLEISGTCGSVGRVQRVAPADLPRFVRLKLVVSIQPAYQLEDIGVVERIWPGAENHTYSMLDLLRAGVRPALGPDVPVASLNPWKVIEAACYRPYQADQAFAPLVVPRTSTRATLSAGQPADLMLTAGPGKVLLIMLGGRITFSR